jgi:DNA-directed RNA polymerase subunit RPC12/RpoP
VSPGDVIALEDVLDEYFCPVCGSELSLSNFLTPERDYYCPYCATRQTPAVL